MLRFIAGKVKPCLYNFGNSSNNGARLFPQPQLKDKAMCFGLIRYPQRLEPEAPAVTNTLSRTASVGHSPWVSPQPWKWIPLGT